MTCRHRCSHTRTRFTIYDDGGRDRDVCVTYKGTTSGAPSKIGSGADSTNCLCSSSDIGYVD
ncbi:hypothetical protein [Streptomyces sp. NPDC053728]|uniref:hypothetical protein n=1 Tax=Streptomyces sp. NPDC053728 TaxID=3155534 RepID=UPI00342C9370